MSEYQEYQNSQGMRMLNFTYVGSIPYNCVENCTELDRLYNRLPIAEGAVEYWKEMDDGIQVAFFQAHVEHINKKIVQLTSVK